MMLNNISACDPGDDKDENCDCCDKPCECGDCAECKEKMEEDGTEVDSAIFGTGTAKDDDFDDGYRDDV